MERIAQCGIFKNISLIFNQLHSLYSHHLCHVLYNALWLRKYYQDSSKSSISENKVKKIKTKRTSLPGVPKQGPTLLTDTSVGCLYLDLVFKQRYSLQALHFPLAPNNFFIS